MFVRLTLHKIEIFFDFVFKTIFTAKANDIQKFNYKNKNKIKEILSYIPLTAAYIS